MSSCIYSGMLVADIGGKWASVNRQVAFWGGQVDFQIYLATGLVDFSEGNVFLSAGWSLMRGLTDRQTDNWQTARQTIGQ